MFEEKVYVIQNQIKVRVHFRFFKYVLFSEVQHTRCSTVLRFA